MDAKAGDVIWILVEGRRRKTVIDAEGVQRFPRNKLMCYLYDRHPGQMNDLWIAYQNGGPGAPTFEELMRFHMQIGYSVCGFADVFPKASIFNPLW
jgi:hypothetical protein